VCGCGCVGVLVCCDKICPDGVCNIWRGHEEKLQRENVEII
jgi:hypothetical protein